MSAAVYAEPVLRYIDPGNDGGILYELAREHSTLVFDPRPTPIRDGRRAPEPFSLERHGFVLAKRPSAVGLDDEAYAEDMTALVRGLTGASEVHVFNTVVRDEGDPVHNKPAHSVHVDFDRATLDRFVRMLPEGERLSRKRYANVNLWRPLSTVERAPLAVCEGASITQADLRVGHIRMKPDMESPPMSGFNLVYSPAHRWWTFPRMQPDEVLVFRLFDTDADEMQLVAHTAFEDPLSAPDAPPRRSIEVRTLAFFD